MPRSSALPAEKRSAPRLPTFLTCSLKLPKSDVPAYLASCSVTGALLAVGSEVVPGTPVAISLDLPWVGRVVSVSGIVVRAYRDRSFPPAPHRWAIEFDGVTPDSTLLMKYVTTRDILGVRRFR